ncbi:lysis protein [Providencia manganoxydans]|uniref:lysis protein n=1 Tax=Providencia manganoxydans TaxID=2923283 RepID=UPI0034E55AE0
MKLGETIVSVGIILAMTLCVAWQGNRIDKLKISNAELTSQLSQQVEINKDYEKRINSIHELDTKHTTELTNAKAKIDQLRIAAERNPERVYIRASCPKGETNPTSGLDDGATARPTDTAIGNYWLLRQRIAESKQMILGLQDYIRTECSQ